MSSVNTTVFESDSTAVTSEVQASENVLKLNRGDGPKVLVQPANPPMPLISPEALGITVPSHVSSVQQKDLKVKQNLTALSFFSASTGTGIKVQDKPNISRTITASSTLASTISLPVQVAQNVQHYPTNISVPNITMPFVSQITQSSNNGDEMRIAPPVSHAQQTTHPQASKVIIGSIPLKATQPVQVATTSLPTSSTTISLPTSATTTSSLQTSAIATKLQSTAPAPLVSVRSSAVAKSTHQNIQNIHRLPGHTYPPPVLIEGRTESKLTAKFHVKSEQKLENFSETKVSSKGDATRLEHKLNWPISTTKSFTQKQNMFGVPRGIPTTAIPITRGIVTTAIPITYIGKPISARTSITNPSSSHVVVNPIISQPVACTGTSTTTTVPIPIGVASKILQQAPVARQHASFPDNQPIFLAGHRQPVSSIAGTVPGHPSVTLPHNVHPYYFYHGDSPFPRYQGPIAPYVGHSFTPITNAGVRQQINLNPVSLQPSTNTGAAAAVARAATVGAGPVRFNPLVADLRTTAPPYAIPSLTSTEGEAIPGAMYAANMSTNQQIANPGSSPRPSILRKRHNDGSAASIRKPLFQNPTGNDPGSPSSKVEMQRQTASPKQSESLSSSQQSTESIESSASQSMLVKIKQEKKEKSTDCDSA